MSLLDDALARSQHRRMTCSVSALKTAHPELADDIEEALAAWKATTRPFLSKIVEVISERVDEEVPSTDSFSRHAKRDCICP